jgi:diguanylate cyclase (GGDEF)-like protein
VADGVRAAIAEASKAWLFPVTVSIGVVEYPAHGRTIDELVSNAERALKLAKDLGKNRTIVAQPPLA